MLDVKVYRCVLISGERWVLLLSCGHWEEITIRDIHNSEQEFIRKKLSPRVRIIKETVSETGTVPTSWKCSRLHPPITDFPNPRAA